MITEVISHSQVRTDLFLTPILCTQTCFASWASSASAPGHHRRGPPPPPPPPPGRRGRRRAHCIRAYPSASHLLRRICSQLFKSLHCTDFALLFLRVNICCRDADRFGIMPETLRPLRRGLHRLLLLHGLSVDGFDGHGRWRVVVLGQL